MALNIYPIATDAEAPQGSPYVDYVHQVQIVSNVLRYESESGHHLTRRRGPAKHVFVLSYENRPWDDYKTIVDFWKGQGGPTHPFVYQDPILTDDQGNRRSFVVRFDSDVELQFEQHNQVSFAVKLVEVLGVDLPANRVPTGPVRALTAADAELVGNWASTAQDVAGSAGDVAAFTYGGYGFRLYAYGLGSVDITVDGASVGTSIALPVTRAQIWPQQQGGVHGSALDEHTVKITPSGQSSVLRLSLVDPVIEYVV